MTMPEGPPVELKKLSMLVGNWNTSMHSFESPMGPESTTPGKESYGWAFNGMHLEGNHEFQMAGKPDFGRTTWGWDPERRQYQVVWADAMTPSIMVYNGTFADDNTLVVFTTYMMQGKAITEKLSFAFTDPDTYTMRMDCDMSGEMKPMMEEKAVRTKGAVSKTTASKTTTKTSTTKPPAAVTTTKKSG
jgi:hypothetical protein